MIVVLAKTIPKDVDAKNKIVDFSVELIESPKLKKVMLIIICMKMLMRIH